MVWEPRLHLAEVLVGAQLHGSDGEASSLPDPRHHCVLVVLHQKNLLEAAFLCLMAGGRQLLLQRWQQDDMRVRSYEH